MNRLGVIKISHEMVDTLDLLTPWKSLNFEVVKEIIQQSPYKIDSFVFLSTCNRIEIVYKIEDAKNHVYFFEYIIQKLPKISFIPQHITGRPVVLHLLKLCSGLESMVLGETEIRYQVKEAVKTSIESHTMDSLMHQLFQNIFRESKEIRKHIPANIPLSISSLGIRNLEERLGGFASHNEYFIVIGSGTISKACIEYIKKWGGNDIFWVNRTKEKILEEANKLNVKALSLEEFYHQKNFQSQYNKNICAIVTATSSHEPILTKKLIDQIQKKKLIIVDLAMPSDVEEAVKTTENIEVIDLQTIKEQLEKNKIRREEAAKNALSILEDSLYKIEANWITFLTSPILKEIQEKVFLHSNRQLQLLLDGHLKHLSNKEKRILYDWAKKYHKGIHRIQKIGIEKVLQQYYKIYKS